MAIDMFLKIGNINGESLDATHKSWVDVLAWSWGISNSGSTHVGGGAGAGQANFQDLSYTSYLDASTAPLMKAVATGQHLKSAFLNVRRAGSAPTEFLKITMTEVLVTSLSTGGSGGEERHPELCQGQGRVPAGGGHREAYQRPARVPIRHRGEHRRPLISATRRLALALGAASDSPDLEHADPRPSSSR